MGPISPLFPPFLRSARAPLLFSPAAPDVFTKEIVPEQPGGRPQAPRHAAAPPGSAGAFMNGAEIKIRAEQKAGELLIETARSGEWDPGGRGRIASRPSTQLKDLGITRDQSSNFQAIASIPDADFEHDLEETKRAKLEVTSAEFVRKARAENTAGRG